MPELEERVRTHRELVAQRGAAPSIRPIGWLRGKITVPDSSFDPLPDELQELFEGKGESDPPKRVMWDAMDRTQGSR